MRARRSLRTILGDASRGMDVSDEVSSAVTVNGV